MCGRTEEAIEIWEEGLENAENLVSNNKKSDYINLGLGNRVCSPLSLFSTFTHAPEPGPP